MPVYNWKPLVRARAHASPAGSLSYSSEMGDDRKDDGFLGSVMKNRGSNDNDHLDGDAEETAKYEDMSLYSEDTNDHVEDDPKTKRAKIRKTVIRIVSSNAALVFFLIGYSFIGAAIFQAIEAPVEQREIEENELSKEKMVTRLWRNTLDLILIAQGGIVNQTNATVKANKTMEESEDMYRHVVDNGLSLNSTNWKEMFRDEVEEIMKTDVNPKWTFWGSLFFCATVYTTVGYGHIVPKSDAGRVATMIYALLGIPLCLITLASLGKLLTRVIKLLYNVVRRQYRKFCTSCATCCRSWKGKKSSISKEDTKENSDLNDQDNPFRFHASSTDTTGDEKDLAKKAAREKRRKAREKALEKIDDNYNLPVSAAAVILAVYIALGAWMYTIWEVDWKDYLEAFYFLFISLSTIGFGDITPKHPNNFIASFMYILLGFALISMTVNVIMQVMANKIDDTIKKTKKTVVVVEKRVAYAAKSAADVTKRKATIVGRKVAGAIHRHDQEENRPGVLSNGLAMAHGLTDSCSMLAKASSDSVIVARTGTPPSDAERIRSQSFVLESDTNPDVRVPLPSPPSDKKAENDLPVWAHRDFNHDTQTRTSQEEDC